MNVPDWRPGALYHRALTDENGTVTGLEVTVYPMLFGEGRVCVGPLASDSFDQEWTYDTIGEAVWAAEEWDGVATHPPGNWTKFRDGTKEAIRADDAEPDSAEDRRNMVNSLVRYQFPEVARAMRAISTDAASAVQSMEVFSDTIGSLTVKDFAAQEVVDEIAGDPTIKFTRLPSGELRVERDPEGPNPPTLGKKSIDEAISTMGSGEATPTQVTIQEYDDIRKMKRSEYPGKLIVQISRVSKTLKGPTGNPLHESFTCILEAMGVHEFQVGARLPVSDYETYEMPF